MRPLGLFSTIVGLGAVPMVFTGIWLGDTLAGEPTPATPSPSAEVREDFGNKETPYSTTPYRVTPHVTRTYKTPHGRAYPRQTRTPSRTEAPSPKPTRTSSSSSPEPTAPRPVSSAPQKSFEPVLEESSGAAVLLK